MKSEYRPLKSLVRRKIGYGIVQPGKDNVGEVHLIKVNNIISGLKNIEDLDRTTSEIEKKYARTRLKGGELVISVVGTPGRTAIVPKSFAGCNLVRAVALIDIVDCLTSWVKYYIDSPNGQNYILQNLNTTVQPTLNIKDLSEMPILIMDRKKMESIVSILSAIDRKIEFNNRINENLESQAQAIFKSWFVDFEPFGGVMPEDWKITTLGEISEMSAGGDKPRNATEIPTTENTVPIYSNGISNEGLYGFTDKAKVVEESVTVSARGTIGYVCLRQTPYVPIVRLITIVPKTSIISAKYIYLQLKTMNISGTGTTQQQLTVPNFKSTELLKPNIAAVNKFTSIVNPMFEKIKDNKIENQQLASLRDTLLPKLMNGEIDVSEVKT